MLFFHSYYSTIYAHVQSVDYQRQIYTVAEVSGLLYKDVVGLILTLTTLNMFTSVISLKYPTEKRKGYITE
jgi:hypothetical protein